MNQEFLIFEIPLIEPCRGCWEVVFSHVGLAGDLWQGSFRGVAGT